MSEEYDPDNLLDRNTPQATMEVHYEQVRRREAAILARAPADSTGGDVLSVGCGWNPGPAHVPGPAWRDDGRGARADQARRPAWPTASWTPGFAGRAGELGLEPGSFDVVLYRLVLHHIAYQGPLAPVFEEAAALLRPGGALIAVEPGAWHPVGAGLSLANRRGRRHRGARHPGRHPAVAAAADGARRAPPGLDARAARGDLHLAADAAGAPACDLARGLQAGRPSACRAARATR